MKNRLLPCLGFIQFYFDGAILNGLLSVNADWSEIESAKALILMRRIFVDPSIISDESKTLRSMIGGAKVDPKN